MTHNIRKIREYIHIKTLEDFFSIIQEIDPAFFDEQFLKSTPEYINDIKALLNQIEDDAHFVHILKQKTHVFQLQWKESVLIAHLKLLVSRIPTKYQVNPAIIELKAG